ELRIAAIETRDAPQPPQHVAQMAAENAAVRVQFVENDVAQIFEEACPTRVVRKDANMQHVRICKNHIALFANGFARVNRYVAIINENAERIVEPLVQVVEFSELILRERFRKKEIKNARIGVFENCVQYQQIITK